MIDCDIVQIEDLERQLAERVKVNFDEEVRFLRKLVLAKSENTFEGLGGEANKKDPIELEVAELLVRKLSDWGLTPRRLGATKNRPNVVCRVGPRRYRKSLLLNGHMDTSVAGPGERVVKLGQVVGRRMYGTGVLDMKGTLAAYLFATKALLDLGVELDGKLILALVADGEAGACSELGTRFLLGRGVRARAALLGKPFTHTVAIGHRGGYRFRLKVKGEAVHTGLSLWERRKMGLNAIVKMAEAIVLLGKIEIPFKTAKLFSGRRPVFTFPTKIEGGGSINLVPDWCEALGDVRLMPGNSDRQIRLLIEARLKRIKDFRYEIEDLLFVPAVEIDAKEELVQLVAESAEAVLGKKPDLRGVGPWNDAWMYITNDVPTVCGFGPDGGNLHKEDEWISLSSLKRVTEIYARVILKYLGVRVKK